MKNNQGREKHILDWDAWHSNCYTYYEPLCYQLFPETENQKHWGSDGNIFFTYFAKMCVRLLGLDKTPEPGYTILYIIGKCLFYVYILFYILVIYSLYLLVTKGVIYWGKKR